MRAFFARHLRPRRETVDVDAQNLAYRDLAFRITRGGEAPPAESDKSPEARYARAAARFVAGDLESSLAEFTALAEAEDLQPAWLAAARVLNQMGKSPEARPVCGRALAIYRGFDAYMEAAAAAYLAGDTSGANTLLGEAKAARPSHFEALQKETAPLKAELAAALDGSALYRPHESDKYDSDEFVTTYWNGCHTEFTTFNRRQTPNALAYELMLTEVSDDIAKLKPSAFLDFGCACGLPLDLLAERYPDIQFAGIDRQTILKRLNEERYSRSNLSFADGDVLDFLPTWLPGTGGKMLCHVRTGIMVYPAYLDKLYRMCRETGVDHIVLYEVASLSADSFRFRDEGEVRSEIHRSIMFLHDYPTMLREAGFDHVTVRRMAQGHGLLFNNMSPGDTYRYITASVA